MDAIRAELSAAATTLDELTSRVEGIAGRLLADRREDLAGDLYEVERALRMAQVRLARSRDHLG